MAIFRPFNLEGYLSVEHPKTVARYSAHGSTPRKRKRHNDSFVAIVSESFVLNVDQYVSVVCHCLLIGKHLRLSSCIQNPDFVGRISLPSCMYNAIGKLELIYTPSSRVRLLYYVLLFICSMMSW